MNSKSLERLFTLALVALVSTASPAAAQGVAPAAPKADSAQAAPRPSPVSGIRNKISAGDLLSAESILEVHQQKHGDGGAWVNGLGWLARGALLLGETDKAGRYASQVRTVCAERLAGGADLEKDSDLELALGAAIEVEAQLIARSRGTDAAVKHVRAELDRLKGPVALRSRLNKRINLLSITGRPAPELSIEDWVGDRPPMLASLEGKPVVLFLWAEWCGDCKAQAAALAGLRKRHADQGLQVLAVTRYYDEAEKRGAEKARVDSVWTAAYPELASVPRVLSTASMERYGASATPTFVFVDRAGIVRRYTPTRLTEAELDRAVAAILK